MQPSDEHSPTPGRPSLLSLDQEAEADRQRILADLDEEDAELRTGSRHPLRWLAFGGVVAVLVMVGGVMFLGEEDKPIVPAVIATTPTMPEPAVSGALQVGLAQAGADLPAAVLLDDEPVIAETAPVPPPATPIETADRAAVPVQHSAAPARAKPAPGIKPAKATARKKVAKPMPKGRERLGAPDKKKVASTMPTGGDTEVALLAALVTHAKATKAKHGGVAAKLKQCKSLASSARKACHVRVCAAAKGAIECKRPVAGKRALGA